MKENKIHPIQFPESFARAIWNDVSENNKIGNTFSDLSSSQNFLCELLDASDLLKTIKGQISDCDLGISVIDIPIPQAGVSVRQEIWFGAFVALGLIRNTFSPRKDKNTNLDFSIYNASPLGAKLLESKGIKYFSPEKNLGFHTDGLISDTSILSPKTVGIYNMFFGYQKPGSFFWAPFSKWNRFEEFCETVSNKIYSIEITPITYKNNVGDLIVDQQGIFDIPLIAKQEGLAIPYFNGEIVGCFTDKQSDLIALTNLMRSLESEAKIFYVEQKERRLIILNNWFGAHASDVFEEPLTKAGYTRSFFRAMDEDAILFK